MEVIITPTTHQYDTCKRSFLDLENLGSTFKEYSVDEFLRKLMFTINLYENGKYCTKCKKIKNIEEFVRRQN